MKSLKFQKLNINDADVLSKLQMKKITGGHHGATFCDWNNSVCHDDGDKIYRCSVETDKDHNEICCCGHSDYNNNCDISA